MLRYAFKRVLLLPPTFFFVSLVIFVVLNMAPGRPGEIGLAAQIGEQAGGQEQQESYRIFKEQFGLDKPVVFNTRFALTTDQVRGWLVTAHALRGEHEPGKQRVAAQEALEDGGNYLVRHLIALLLEGSDPADAPLRRWAAWHLTQAAQLSLLDRGADGDARARQRRRDIARLNMAVRDGWWQANASTAEVAAVRGRWRAWWQQRHGEFEYTALEKLHAFFLDTRFATYWSNLLHVDFGRSTVDRRAVLPVIVSKLRYSLSLTLLSVLLAYALAVPIGIWSAVRRDTAADTAVTLVLFVLYSLPTFFTGAVLLRLLSEGDPLAWFPTGGFESLDAGGRTTLQQLADRAWHLVLPIATYASVTLAALSRYARAGIIDVIRADYVRTARAKGLHEAVVIIKHAARNGMIPILTLLGTLLPVLVSGSVVIEVVFGIPGMGLFLYDAINLRDYNAVMGVLVIASALTLIGILVSDLSYALADPRITLD